VRLKGNVQLKGSYIYRSSIASYNISHSYFINNVVIPFFDLHLIIGEKSKDFDDFKTLAKYIQQKKHLTPEGFKEIPHISDNMNLRRSK